MTTSALRTHTASSSVSSWTVGGEVDLRGTLERLVRDAVPRGKTSVPALALEALDAFLAHDLDPEAAARLLAPTCRELGRTMTDVGLTDAVLTDVVRTVGRGLRRHVIPVTVRELGIADVETLSRAVQEYLLRLVTHVRQGMHTARHLQTLSPQQRRRSLASAVFGGGDEAGLRALASTCGIDPATAVTPVVSIDPARPLGEALRRHADVVAGAGAGEALVPAGWSNDDVAAAAGTPVARGPASPLTSAGESVRLARATAAVAAPDVAVTESRDVLARLLVASSPVLTELLVAARLGPVAALPRLRRNRLGRTLLTWLDHGRPVNEVARMMGLPPQTVHTRLGIARDLLGDTLTDPDGRLELLAALRVAVPRWEAEPCRS